jgi:hypothetical protein
MGLGVKFDELLLAAAVGGGVWAGLSLMRNVTVPMERFKDVGVTGPGALELPSLDGTTTTTRRPKPANYTDVYIAQRFTAVDLYGELGRDANGAPIPGGTSDFGQNVLDYWVRTVNRLCGLTGKRVAVSGEQSWWEAVGGNVPHVTTITLTPINLFAGDGPSSIPSGSVDWSSPISLASAQKVLEAWKLHGARARSYMLTVTKEGREAFWDAVGRLAIAVNVDRAVPDYSGEIWADILDNTKALPADAAATIGAIGKGIGGAVWGGLWGFIQTPVLIAALVGGVVLFREPLINMIEGKR